MCERLSASDGNVSVYSVPLVTFMAISIYRGNHREFSVRPEVKRQKNSAHFHVPVAHMIIWHNQRKMSSAKAIYIYLSWMVRSSMRTLEWHFMCMSFKRSNRGQTCMSAIHHYRVSTSLSFRHRHRNYFKFRQHTKAAFRMKILYNTLSSFSIHAAIRIHKIHWPFTPSFMWKKKDIERGRECWTCWCTAHNKFCWCIVCAKPETRDGRKLRYVCGRASISLAQRIIAYTLYRFVVCDTQQSA